MIQFGDQEITNKQLILDSPTELYYLGHNLTLRNCTLVIKVPARALSISRARFTDCNIETTRELKNFRWQSVFLKGCRFKGRFIGNDFGEWPSAAGQGGIEDCDFSEAHLDATRFLSCDVRTLRFPRWPCFTIFNPVHRARELRKLPWPAEVGRIEVECFAEAPASTAALTHSATMIAKRRGTTLEALKVVLEKTDGVFY